jgi:membrane protein insertase Oxa1/YidC/SpoIIIJ
LLDWLYTAISFVMEQWHALFSTFLDPAGGITWALSIMFLVVTVRLILFPLFVKQVKSQRAMQELQPEIAKLRKQYGSDRQGMSQAMMALQKERGVNPLAGCLPVLPQIPIFLSLFHVLRRLAPGAQGLYGWSDALTDQAARAELFVSGFIFPIGVLLYWVTNNAWTFGQQFFILRKMPPPGSDAAKAKAAAEKPAVDPRTLAPKPGAKPVRTKGARAAGASASTAATTSTVAPTGEPTAADGLPTASSGGLDGAGTEQSTAAPRPAAKGKRKRR